MARRSHKEKVRFRKRKRVMQRWANKAAKDMATYIDSCILLEFRREYEAKSTTD